MPSAWPSTGMRVELLMCFTSALDPRGMHRSMTSSSLSSSATASRPSTSPMHPAGTLPPDARTTVSVITRWRARLEHSASFPPFSSRPFADRSAREAIWGRLSGRDSKMISRTPIGTVFCTSSRPALTSNLESTRPTGSSVSAILLMPSASVWIFSSVSLSRFSKGASRLVSTARARSLAFSSRISALEAMRASATARRTVALSSLVSCNKALPPALASSACCLIAASTSSSIVSGCPE
mmetsp:Transcript_37211/g.64936  ORF Transcript_37211/g.64936 Transcript_37211/m.64936 type:complete len:239 (+) Transcript_37211:1033-1749(+)